MTKEQALDQLNSIFSDVSRTIYEEWDMQEMMANETLSKISSVIDYIKSLE